MSVTKKILVTVALIIFIVCIAKITYATTGIVTADSLNLRESASTSSDVKTTIKKDQEVEILGQEGDWYQIEVNNISGYVHSDYIEIKEEQVKNEEQQGNTNVEEQVKNEEPSNQEIQSQITVSKEIDIYILPLINASKISKTKQNETVTVLGSTNKWLYISSEEVNGWILKSLVVNESTQNTSNNAEVNNTQNNDNQTVENNDQVTEKTMYVNAASIYVRKGPGTNYPDIGGLVYNNAVTVIGEEDDWYKVIVDGEEGYIAKWLLSDTKKGTTSRGEATRITEVSQNTQDLSNNENGNLEQETTNSLGNQIVDYAKQYLGCKYVYGGSGPSVFDCSGFTMYVYSKFGISLSHSATAQAKKGTYVAKEDLQPGDLVFFKDYETMEGIGHCGIYIGNGDFIHASSGAGYCVKISTLLSGSYNTKYETARRII